MSQVIVGVDESDGAAEALRWAVREAAIHGWTVTAVTAWGFLDRHGTILGERFDPGYGDEQVTEALGAIVASVLGEDAAAAVERRAIADLPAQALVDASADAELLVVGARGLGGFRGLLLGSVSQHCLQHATCPVAVVRHHPDQPADGASRGRVVAAVDGSEASRRALAWAADEARLRAATLVVVNAWHTPYLGGDPLPPMPLDPAPFAEGSRVILEEAVASVDPGRLPAQVERTSVHGGAAAVLLDLADGADLVVMGSRGLGGFKGLLLGSVTSQVTHHATCPVVVIRDAEQGSRR